MLFIISAFIATAMGTSMGTIAACAPIAFGFSQATITKNQIDDQFEYPLLVLMC
jgi:uncharacterized membrane protein